MGGPAYIDGKKFPEFDNFYPCNIYSKNGPLYPSVEHAFQAQKNDDDKYKLLISFENAQGAWELGQKVKLRYDWEDVKVSVMEALVKRKLLSNPAILEKLLSTEGPIVFKHSSPFWNQKNAEILEKLREEFNV